MPQYLTLKNTLEQNRKVVIPEGRIFYYSKIAIAISLVKYLSCIFLGGYMVTVGEIKSIIISLLLFSYSVYFIIKEVLPRLMYKNPLFMLKGQMLYYTRAGRWYDLSNKQFYSFSAHKNNYSLTLRVLPEIEEDFWYIASSAELKHLLRKIKSPDGLYETR